MTWTIVDINKWWLKSSFFGLFKYWLEYSVTFLPSSTATSTLSISQSKPFILFRATYRRIADRNNPPAKKVLDIGTATGHPLKSIINTFKDAEVVGIDIDKNYVPACQKLFKNHENVTIKLMNFYDLSIEYPNTQFDTIIFGSSFMLMPDQSKAIEIAKSINIFYFRTLNKKRKDLLLTNSLRWEITIQQIHVAY